MKPLLVLGLGNRLMMDDGIGVVVVEALSRQHPPDGTISYAIGETDFDYCLDLATRAKDLVIVDAAITGKRPGDISTFPLLEMACQRPGLSLHHVHFLDVLLQLDAPRSGTLIGIEPHQIDFHLGLSRTLDDQLDAIVDKVKAAIGYRRSAVSLGPS